MSVSGMGCWNTALVLDNIWERPISKLQTLIDGTGNIKLALT